MNDSKKAPGCFKVGCFGCLGVIAAFFVMFLVLGAIQLRNDSREPVIEQVERRQQISGEPFVYEVPSDSGEGLVDGALVMEPAELRRILPLPEDLAAADVAPGTVMLDLSAGNFVVRPGDPGEPLRVEAEFDTASFRLEEELVDDGAEGWSYRVKFGARGGFFGLIGDHEVDNEITVVIPRGRPITLVGEVGLGESEIDLGGLWLREVDLDLGAGEHLVEFSEPTLEPVASVRLEGWAGALEVRGLGNASPATALVEQSFGETRVDLRGAWRGDGEVHVSFGFGECRVRQPENARIVLGEIRMTAGERRISLDDDDLPEDAPTVRLSASGTAGELRIE